MLTIKYNPGPNDRVLRAYLRCRPKIAKGIMGPVGGAKTSAAMMDFMVVAAQQAPHPETNIRQTRFAVLRDTYRNLERTTLRTWKEWVPDELGKLKGGSGGEPAIQALSWDLPDGTIVNTEFLFVAVGETDIELVARGWELTGFLINEGDTLPQELFNNLLSRVGRYPRVDFAAGFDGATWSGGCIDFNAPNHGNWTDVMFVNPQTRPAGFEFFRQPGGLDPAAENTHNLPKNYYLRLAEANPDWWVRRFIHNQLGFSRDGKPVYPEFNDMRHASGVLPLKPARDRRVYCGLDAGRWPSAVFIDRTTDHRIRVLKELVCEGIGAREFGHQLRDFSEDHFRNSEIVYCADPAAFNPTELSEHDEDAWVDIVGNEISYHIIPAPSNRRAMREQSLRDAMSKPISGTVERFEVSPECPMIREGLNHKFRYRKIAGSEERYAMDVDKNRWSHPCEALEYAVLTCIGLPETLGIKRKPVTDNSDLVYWRPRW